MKYAEMSDFEINKAVGMATGEATVSEPVFKQVIRNSNGREFNPCNSWADAGPIIVENGIGLMPFKKSPAKAWSTSAGLLGNANVQHANPLRAAMIIFLMMRGEK